MSRSQPGVPVRAMSYSRIARPQLGHAGVLPTGCSGDLNKLNWGIAPLFALPRNSQQRNLFREKDRVSNRVTLVRVELDDVAAALT